MDNWTITIEIHTADLHELGALATYNFAADDLLPILDALHEALPKPQPQPLDAIPNEPQL